jgi:hypothetical protein
MARHHLPKLASALTLVAVAAPLAACGSSSGKPGYCDKRQQLTEDVKGLTSVNVRDNGLGAVRTQLEKIRADGQALVSSAKSDFPDETGNLKLSIDNLKTTLEHTSSQPSIADIAVIGGNVASITNAAKALTGATGGKC